MVTLCRSEQTIGRSERRRTCDLWVRPYRFRLHCTVPYRSANTLADLGFLITHEQYFSDYRRFNTYVQMYVILVTKYTIIGHCAITAVAID